MKTKKIIEDFGAMKLPVIPPPFLQMMVTTVKPSAEGNNKWDVTCQEWKLFWN